VRLQPLPYNWVRLPHTVSSSLLGTTTSALLVLRLKHVINTDREFYVAWNGLPCREAGCIDVPQKLGEALGLQEGDIVRPEVVSGLPVAKQIHASVASADDWEVVECNAENLTKALLLQVQVVRKGDTLPIWIRGQSTVNVVIQSAQPQDVVLLKNDTIVSIEPPQKPAAVDVSSAPVNNNTATANDIEPSKVASTDACSIRDNWMLADVLRQTPTSPTISGPMRLRVKVCCFLSTST
jgi:Peroxisome biogenesis factor 1, N-terminal